MDFGRFSPNFIEFGRFFQKSAGSEGADFLVSAGFLNIVGRCAEGRGVQRPGVGAGTRVQIRAVQLGWSGSLGGMVE
jgi:hypothetical protein